MKQTFNTSSQPANATAALLDSWGIPYVRHQNGAFLVEGDLATTFRKTGPKNTSDKARALAEAATGSDNAFLRLNLAEYSEAHSIAQLIGAPPGFVGFDEPSVSDKIRAQPYLFLLLEEVNKGHPRVLQLLEDGVTNGVLPDNKGNKVPMDKLVVMMTADKLTPSMQLQKVIYHATVLQAPVQVGRPLRFKNAPAAR